MTDGHYRDNKTAREALTRLSEEYPDLQPLPDETAVTWAYRAIAWLTRICRPIKHSDMTGRMRIKAIRRQYFPKTVEEFKEVSK